MEREEICGQVIDMAESAIQCSKMIGISNDIHKIGLVATLNDIMLLIEEYQLSNDRT